MNADKVQGGGELFASMSERLGRRGQYGPVVVKPLLRGIATLSGRDGAKSVISSSDLSSKASDLNSRFESMDPNVSVGEDVMDNGTVFTLSVGFAGLLMLMPFQMPLSVRRAWRSLDRSSLGRPGCERRTWKARLAGGRQDRHGMLADGRCYRLNSCCCRCIDTTSVNGGGETADLVKGRRCLSGW